ncbi:expressed unknown protein [Seminavis robusta]|uniref:Uncharacterized protein n=1 Tax=Seminavis robusta TaxID=568900 RepID=A0A9N8HM53_9STRA|nr:expressed unknown protein [Seminavis robusta]|eukprot:Sro969_g226190.1 n/a (745) ;mRNA; r:13745-16074
MMDWYNNDEDNHRLDDDIIVVQETRYHHHPNDSLLIDQQSQNLFLLSPTQRRSPRRQRPLGPGATAAILAASQEEARQHYFGGDGDDGSASDGDEASHNQEEASPQNAFASLESLLQQQPTLSMTQEEEGNHGGDEAKKASCLPVNKECGPLDTSVTAKEDDEKENAQTPLSASISQQTKDKPKRKEGERDGDKHDDPMAFRDETRVPEKSSSPAHESWPTTNDDDGNDRGRSDFVDSSGIMPPRSRSHSSNNKHSNKKRSAEYHNNSDFRRQQQRRTSSSRSNKTSTKQYKKTIHHSPSMMMMEVEPSKALRRQLQKSKKTSRSRSADRQDLTNSRPWKRRQHRSSSPAVVTQKRSKSPTVEKSNRSLVGSRPAGWERGPLGGISFRSSTSRGRSKSGDRQRKRPDDSYNNNSSTRLRQQQQNGRRRNTTKQDTAFPINALVSASFKTTTTTTPTTRKRGPSIFDDRTQMMTTTNDDSDPEPMDVDQIEDNLSDGEKEETPTNKSAAVQHTSFLATVRAPSRRKSTGDKSGDAVTITNNNPGLLKLLQKLRNDIQRDKTCLRSGEYPFPNKISSRFDDCDPRCRASSYMDVTIVGETWFPSHDNGSSGRQARSNSSMVVLGYIHSHHLYPERSAMTSITQPTSSCFAWINFSGETLQEHGLLSNPAGNQLRIYNAVVVPLVVDKSVDSQEEMATTNVCRFNVICSQLCEPYPTQILGQLEPTISELLAPTRSEGGLRGASLAP